MSRTPRSLYRLARFVLVKCIERRRCAEHVGVAAFLINQLPLSKRLKLDLLSSTNCTPEDKFNFYADFPKSSNEGTTFRNTQLYLAGLLRVLDHNPTLFPPMSGL